MLEPNRPIFKCYISVLLIFVDNLKCNILQIVGYLSFHYKQQTVLSTLYLCT